MLVEPREIAGQRCLVLTPTRHHRVDRSRLEFLRQASSGASSIDWAAIDGVKTHPETRVMLFRGRSDDGKGSWGFDEDLTRDEVYELGYLIARSQVPTWIELMRLGIVSFLHVEWELREVLALDQGRERLVEELQSGDSNLDERMLAIHRWVLERMCGFMHTSLENAEREVLPSIAPLLERRAEQARALLAF